MPKHQEHLYKVSSWIRQENDGYEKNGLKIYPIINGKKFDEIINYKDKTIQEKFDLMIKQLATSQENITVNNQNKTFLARCWIKNNNELLKLFQEALDKSFVNGKLINSLDGSSVLFNGMSFKGLKYFESIQETNKDSKKIFVAFNFEDELITVFNKYVKEAVEELDFIYTVINQNNSEHDKAISDEIIAKLKSCKILIADFTNQRNSVYFEAGFAMGMKIPIIWTCQEGHTKDLSFDTRQYPHLVWNDGEDLKKQIKNRIKVIV